MMIVSEINERALHPILIFARIQNHMNSVMMEYSVPPFPHYETLWGALLDPLKQNQAVEASIVVVTACASNYL